MNNQNIISDIEKYLYKLRSKENNIGEYYSKEMRDLSNKSKIIYLISVCKLFENDEQRNKSRRIKELNPKPLINVDVDKLTKQDINNYLSCKWFLNLSNATKNQHLVKVKKYLRFSNREDLIEALGDKRFKEKKKTLSKNDLISRDDLELILKHCNLKLRTLIMVMYEGALRIDETLNILFKHVKFNGGYVNLRIETSKTKKRDIPLTESIPYLKEYFDNRNFEPNDKIFPYDWNTSLNVFLYNLAKKLAIKFPDKWKGRKLNPHIFRHSKLTELAAGKLNEAQIRKLAGWEPGSPMPEIYFHLDDSDVINIMTKGNVRIPEPKKFEPVNCTICNAENNAQNLLCWKCKNLLDESKRNEAGIKIFTQPDDIENIKDEFSELKNKLNNMENVLKLQEQYIFHLIAKDKYPDLDISELSEDIDLTNLIIKEYNTASKQK